MLASILVQLFSKPQKTAASNTSNEPQEKLKLEISSKESKMLDRVTRTIACQSRAEIDSLKMHRAIKEVATISKLFSNDALAAAV